jgi:hypothetical protein
MFNLVNLNDVREEMIMEIQSDIEQGKLYISDRLNSDGKREYPKKLLEAVRSLDVREFTEAFGMHYFNSYYQRRSRNGAYSQVRMPSNANCTLCEGEFNRFYIRGVCLKANALGKNFVTAYRASPSENPRPESVVIENRQFAADKLLNDLRTNIGIDTALGIPPGPNSGMSVKL